MEEGPIAVETNLPIQEDLQSVIKILSFMN